MSDGQLDQGKRAAEKMAARERDRERLASGEVTPEQLAKENNWFRGFDLRSFEIMSIGNRPIHK